jgi:hypothetical protein
MKIPKFNDHGSNCKGHANYMLDCEYENQEDRELLVKVLDNYIDEDTTTEKSRP